MQPIITVEHLSKQYRLGAREEQHDTLRDSLASALRSPLARFKPGGRGEVVDALKDVSFDVQSGEIVGLIGRNGAGKSTLFKLLSRITEPTGGRAVLKGRLASLLEVGTGFHPDLSGRENISLNGAILGMKRREIERKFDEIVAFAEVEKFIDTPVKRYSMGMYLRLAFAVAAHLEPEILIVDEVLAVGDANFQKKCLNKMQDVGQEGRTVLFVSHNMSAITRLCGRAILLDGGSVLRDGPSSQVVTDYLRAGLGTSGSQEWPDLERAPGNDIVRLQAVRVRDENGQVAEAMDIRRPIAVEMEYQVLQAGHHLSPNFHFFSEEGVYVFVSIDTDEQWRKKPRPAGHYRSVVTIPGNLLTEGTLIVGAAISTMDPVVIHFFERDAVAFHVTDKADGDAARGDFDGSVPGYFRPLLPWTTQLEPTPISIPRAISSENNGLGVPMSTHAAAPSEAPGETA